MTSCPGLGSLSILPYEVREHIWREFLPDFRKKMSKSDLRLITRVSKVIYEEVSEVVYSQSYLRFDLWQTFKINHWNHSARGKVELVRRVRGHEDILGMWNWRDEQERFDNFPLHRLRAVEVQLTAPCTHNPDQAFWLWRNVVKTVELLSNGQYIPRLTVYLQRNKNQDWYNNWVGQIMLERYERRLHDFILRPFFLLQNVREIEIIPHSDTLRNILDWSEIRWALSVTAMRTPGLVTPRAEILERHLRKKAADDLSWVESAIICEFLLQHRAVQFMLWEAQRLDYIFVFRQRLGVKEEDGRDPRTILFNGWRWDEQGLDVLSTFAMMDKGNKPSRLFLDRYPELPYNLKEELSN